MLVVALLVVSKSGVACGCLPIEVGQGRDPAVTVAAEFAANVAASDVRDSDPIPVGSTPKGGCTHCCCQQPSLPQSPVCLVSFVVLPADHVSLPAPDTSNWATSPFRPPISMHVS